MNEDEDARGWPEDRNRFVCISISVRGKCGRKKTRSKRNLSDERSCGFYCNFYGRDIPRFRYTPTELSDGYLAGLASNSLEQRVFWRTLIVVSWNRSKCSTNIRRSLYSIEVNSMKCTCVYENGNFICESDDFISI